MTRPHRDPLVHVSARAAFGRFAARWEPDYERVVVQIGENATIHIDPADVRALIDQLQVAVDVADGHCEAPQTGGTS